MIDLNRMNAGKKLFKQVTKSNKSMFKNIPEKNCHTKKSRLKKK